jgi:hypothetical protein
MVRKPLYIKKPEVSYVKYTSVRPKHENHVNARFHTAGHYHARRHRAPDYRQPGQGRQGGNAGVEEGGGLGDPRQRKPAAAAHEEE